MVRKRFKVKRIELLLIAATLMSLVIPVYHKLAQGWNPLENNEQTMIMVVRAVSAKNDTLGLEKYCIEGITNTVAVLPTPRSMSQDLFRLDNSGVKVINEAAEGLIEVSRLDTPQIHAFNEKILLISGSNNILPVANAF